MKNYIINEKTECWLLHHLTFQTKLFKRAVINIFDACLLTPPRQYS